MSLRSFLTEKERSHLNVRWDDTFITGTDEGARNGYVLLDKDGHIVGYQRAVGNTVAAGDSVYALRCWEYVTVNAILAYEPIGGWADFGLSAVQEAVKEAGAPESSVKAVMKGVLAASMTKLLHEAFDGDEEEDAMKLWNTLCAYHDI